MEPPAKRARHGRAPHDEFSDFSDFAMPMDYNSKNTGCTKGQAGKDDRDYDDDDDDEQDDEDEIAMDPEDYAMKLNPQYRFQKSRAVADNRLKSAFELLFEKYGKDFGDTGDEINFYTDEIEVDNGHITSILAEEDNGDEDEDDKDARRNGRNAEELGRGLSLLSSGPVLAVREEPAVNESAAAPRPAIFGSEPVDPTWAAPAIPDEAFTTPRHSDHATNPPRIAYSVPHRSIFRKSLPESFGSVAGAKDGEETAAGGRGKFGTDDNDDLLMDTSEPILKFSNGAKTPRRRVSNWAGPSPGRTAANSPSLPPASSVLPTTASAPAIPPPPPSSVLSDTAHPMAPKPTSNENTETFSRNKLDPSYAFSDDEDFGLKRRSTAPKPASQPGTEAGAGPSKDDGTKQAALELSISIVSTPTTEKKRGPGRPRTRPSKPLSEKQSADRRKSTQDPASSVAVLGPHPGADTPTPSKRPFQDLVPAPVQVQLQPGMENLCNAVLALPQRRRVGRPRKIRSSVTPTSQSVAGQEEMPLSSPQPMSIASTPSKPPTQEHPKELSKESPQPAAQVPAQHPQKRSVGRPRKIRELESTNTLVDIPADQEVANGLEQVALSSPQPAPTPSKPPTQKRRVGRPKKAKEAEDDKASAQAQAQTQAHSSPDNRPTERPTSATSTPSKSPRVLSPPLWQSVTQFQQKRRVGRPRKGVPVDDPAPSEPVADGPETQAMPGLDANAFQRPSQQPPSQELPQPLSQVLSHVPKSASPRKSGRAEIPDSQATNSSSNANTSTSAANRTYALHSSRRSEVPDSEANLPSSIISLVSNDDDDDDDDGDDGNGNNNSHESDYDAVHAAMSSHIVGLGGSRRSPSRLSPARLSPMRRSPSRLSPAAVTPVTTARFVLIPRSGTASPVGAGSGRASPLAKSVLRTPSPVKFMQSKLTMTGAASPSGSVVQTPGGTMRRCGQDGFRCEREFCFRCA